MGISIASRLSGTGRRCSSTQHRLKPIHYAYKREILHHGDDGLERHTKNTRQENYSSSETKDASTHACSVECGIRTCGIGLGAIERADGRSKRRDGAREACSWRAS